MEIADISPSSSPVRQTSSRNASINLTQKDKPRATFNLSEDYLAQSAAEAYRSNQAYTEIEKETLAAIAPFLDIQKKDVVSDIKTSPTSHSRAYAHHHHQDSSVSTLESSDSMLNKHRRGSSASSITFEDFRKHAQTVPNLPSAMNETSFQHRIPRRMTTSGLNPYPEVSSAARGIPTGQFGGTQSFLAQFEKLRLPDERSVFEAQDQLQKRLRCSSLVWT